MRSLICIANFRFPSERANSIQTVRMCQALASHVDDVHLIVPFRFQERTIATQRKGFGFYGIVPRFRVTRLPCFDIPRDIYNSALIYYLQSLTFAVSAAVYVVLFARSSDIYTRHFLSLLLLTLLRPLIWGDLVYEAHDFPERTISKRVNALVLGRADLVVVLNGHLQRLYASLGIPEERLMVESDAVDIDAFDINVSKEEARRQIGLEGYKRLVVYTGGLFEWKGVYTLADAASRLPADVHVCIVGGADIDLRRMRSYVADNGIANVSIIGLVSPSAIPLYLKAADVLVIPNSGKERISTHYTSPMKVFEYMAARRPIVASDLPSLREVLDEESAVLFTADEPNALAHAIERVLEDDALSKRIVDASFKRIGGYSWERRANRILEHLFTRGMGLGAQRSS